MKLSVKRFGSVASAARSFQRQGSVIMANPRITICPPSPQLEKFDLHQFVRKDRPVSALTGISWQDFANMQTSNGSVPRKSARWIPAFASKMEQLRAVILECDRRNQVALKRFWVGCSAENEKHKKAVKRAGSFRAFLAGIAYRGWLQRLDSIAVAEMMEIQPGNVRQHLYRMLKIARE